MEKILQYFLFCSYNILTVDRVAEEVLNGILRNQPEISIPNQKQNFARLFQVLPGVLQNFIRDKIMKESQRFYVKGMNK
jgi:short-subunit dehydrogenase